MNWKALVCYRKGLSELFARAKRPQGYREDDFFFVDLRVKVAGTQVLAPVRKATTTGSVTWAGQLWEETFVEQTFV